MNYANPQEHVPETERNNRAIKERFMSKYYRLPFKYLINTLVKCMAIEAVKKLNFVAAKYGISKGYSPRVILHQQNLKYEKHCKYTMCTYVQGYNELLHKNATTSRSLDCISLRYNATR